MSRTLLACLILALSLVAAGPAAAERRVALVIGNSDYQNAAALPNPRNDARAVAAALERVGFETVVGLDLDRAGMEDAAIQFARAARDADVAMFYYAGHAMQFAGVNYLMPVDARLTDDADLRRMTRVDEIVADLQQARNLRILVLDACRDNPLAETLKRSIGRSRAASVGRGLARIDSPQGMIVAYATQAGQTADDGDGRNSPYTAAFLKHIATGEEIGRIFRRVSADVYEATGRRQLPELSLSLIGEYYLKGESTAAAPAPSTPAPSTPPAARADAEAWAAIQNTDSEAVLEVFLDRFPDGLYASFAKARLDELRKKARKKVAVGTFAPAAPAAPDGGPTRSLKLRMQSSFTAQDLILGPMARAIASEVDRLSGGRMTLEVLDADAVVRAFQVHDAASKGALDAAFSSPVYVYGKNKAFAALAGVLAFGLEPDKLVKWYEAEGQALADEIYARTIGVKMLPCGIMGPEGGWYSKPITGPSSLKGVKMRTVGIAADFFGAAGATVVQLPGGELVPALQRGIIDASEFSVPLQDHQFGFQDLRGRLKYYYYPSWHEPAEVLDFVVGLKKWNSFSQTERQVLVQACRNTLHADLARLPELERQGLDKLRGAGVTVRRLPRSFLDHARRTSETVYRQLEADPDFRRIRQSMLKYR